MENSLQKLIADLPEIYQMIYNHPEYNNIAVRDCLPRLDIIFSIYDKLSIALQRPLRVLDLGCAQGFYSFNLANKGAIVKGVDHLSQNITLCKFLANEHPELDVTFIESNIEEIIDQLNYDQFDLIVGLSIFHHIVHVYGISKVKYWLTLLLDRAEMVLIEMGLKEEPFYWAVSQPDNLLSLFSHAAFYFQLSNCSTHLSVIKRPLYLLSNKRILLGDFCRSFISWSLQPHRLSNSAHHNSRRYYFGDDFFCKIYHDHVNNLILSNQERIRNRQELRQEINFILQAPSSFPVAHLLSSGENESQGWSIMSRLPGKLLDSKLLELTLIDRENILYQILQQLTCLELAGFYHDDLRTWNIMIDENLQVYIIDYGSISIKKIDCGWPKDILQAFLITISEIISPSTFHLTYNRPLLLSPINLPAPYSHWLYAFYQYKPKEWDFSLLLSLFEQKEKLPSPKKIFSSIDIWIAACEKWLLQRERYSNHFYDRYQQTQKKLITTLREENYNQYSKLENDITLVKKELINFISNVQSLNKNKKEKNISSFYIEPKNINNNTLEDLDKKISIDKCENIECQVIHVESKGKKIYNNKLLLDILQKLISFHNYVKLQLRFFYYQYILNYSLKKIIRYMINIIFLFFQRYPVIKFYVIVIFHKIKKYKLINRIYHYIRFIKQEQQITLGYQKKQFWALQDPKNRLPPVVNTIFNKLRIK